MNFFQVSRALTYYLTSTHRNGHGIHSPFVYNVITQVFKNKTDIRIVNKVKETRSGLQSDRRVIEISDLGSGSLKTKSNRRSISQISRTASIPEKYGLLLSRFAASVDGKPIFELGTSLGISTLYMALGAQSSMVHTIEGCSNIADRAGRVFSDARVPNIVQYMGSFDDQIEGLCRKEKTPGLIFIDGDHKRESVIRYFEKLKTISSSDTIMIIDDIHLSSGMEEGWNQIISSSEVSVALDIFRMGILFFRKDIAKQEITIRY